MSFQTKSAWVMALVMTGAGLYYLQLVREASVAAGGTAPPATAIGYVFVVVAASVVAQVVLAVLWRSEAQAPTDERERLIQQRAGAWSGHILASLAVLSLGHFLLYADGNMLFHSIMASLIVAQIGEYVLHIVFERLSI